MMANMLQGDSIIAQLLKLSWSTWAAVGFSAFVAYIIGLAIWRLYLCPLANIPGPKFAALTFWHEIYYDNILDGRYAFKILEMHEKYGPIVRINPHEVHISDPEFHHVLYPSATARVKIDKWHRQLRSFGDLQSGLTTLSHDVHKLRRNAYQNYFSRQAIRQMEPEIQTVVNKLMDRFEDFKRSSIAIEIQPSFAAMTCDFIHAYCFQSTLDLCSRPDLGRDLYNAMLKVGQTAPLIRNFPFLEKIMARLPTSLRLRLNPNLASLIELKQSFVPLVAEAINVHGTDDEKKLGKQEAGKQTLLNAIIDSKLPDPEKSPKRLRDEAQTMSLAGTLTTAMALTKSTYEVLSNPSLYVRLMQELRSAAKSEDIPAGEAIPLQTLESLPLLNACLYETLRCHYGTTNRHARVRQEEQLIYKPSSDILLPKPPRDAYILGPGTPVSMSTVSHHSHAHIWPEPRRYNPDRFLPIDGPGASGLTGHQLFQKFVGSFNAGTRQCAGMNLAEIEILMGLAELFRRFGGEVVGEGNNAKIVGGMRIAPWVDKERDVDTKRDLVVPFPGKDSRGVWIELHESK